MFRRLQTAAAVLVLAAAAVAVPILVIEAGSSTTVGDGRTLNATFLHRDAATGDNLTIWLYASEQTYTQRYQDTGGGGGGLGRAQGSSRAGGSSRPHDGGSQTYTSRYLDVNIDRHDGDWNLLSYSYGSASPASLVISDDLSGGSVTGAVTVETWDPAGNYLGSETVDVDLDFTATGPLRTTRESYRSHVRSPRERSNYMTTTSRRDASTAGAVMLSGDNVAAGSLWYAEIATFASRSSYTSSP